MNANTDLSVSRRNVLQGTGALVVAFSMADAGKVLQKSGLIPADESVESAVDGLIDPQYIQHVVKKLASL